MRTGDPRSVGTPPCCLSGLKLARCSLGVRFGWANPISAVGEGPAVERGARRLRGRGSTTTAPRGPPAS